MVNCPKCGAAYDETFAVCPHCGTQYQSVTPTPESETKPETKPDTVSPTVPPEESTEIPVSVSMPPPAPDHPVTAIKEKSPAPAKSKNPRKGKLIVIIAIVCAVLIAGAVTLILIFSRNSENNDLDHQISLGEKYLSEEQYDEAIRALKKAIEIDPNNPDLYLLLSEAYLGKGDESNAILTLQQGYEITASAMLKQKWDELLAIREASGESSAAALDENSSSGTSRSETTAEESSKQESSKQESSKQESSKQESSKQESSKQESSKQESSASSKKLSSISITRPPAKTSYYIGENINFFGLIVTATYTDGSTKDVTDQCHGSTLDSSTPGIKIITIYFEDQTTTFPVTVVQRTQESSREETSRKESSTEETSRKETSVEESSLEETSKAEASTEKPSTTAEWKTAYQEKMIYYMENDNSVSNPTFELFDVDSDGIPELFLSEYAVRGSCTCFSYINNELVQGCRGLFGTILVCQEKAMLQPSYNYNTYMSQPELTYIFYQKNAAGFNVYKKFHNQGDTYKIDNEDVSKETYNTEKGKLDNLNWQSVGGKFPITKENIDSELAKW